MEEAAARETDTLQREVATLRALLEVQREQLVMKSAEIRALKRGTCHGEQA